MIETRSKAIGDAIRLALVERAAILDRAHDLGQVTVTVKLQVGTPLVRTVVFTEERITKRNGEANGG